LISYQVGKAAGQRVEWEGYVLAAAFFFANFFADLVYQRNVVLSIIAATKVGLILFS